MQVADAAKAKLERIKRRQAWPADSPAPGTPYSASMGRSMASAGFDQTAPATPAVGYSPASSPGETTVGMTFGGGGMPTTPAFSMDTTMGAPDGPRAASRTQGLDSTLGASRSGKGEMLASGGAAANFTLERTAGLEASRRSLPPLSAGATLDRSASVSVMEQSAARTAVSAQGSLRGGMSPITLGGPGGGGGGGGAAPSTPGGRQVRTAGAASAGSAGSASRMKRRLRKRAMAKIAASPLSYTRARPSQEHANELARTQQMGSLAPPQGFASGKGGGGSRMTMDDTLARTAPARSGGKQGMAANLQSLGVLSGGGGAPGGGMLKHTHAPDAPDHAVERRMCHACWSQPHKRTAAEAGLRGLAAEVGAALEAQGPTSWSSDDIRDKFRDEDNRNRAWAETQAAMEEAAILEREEGIIVPVVAVDKHPVWKGVELQIKEENSASLRRARHRNAMKVFSYDVRAVWLSGDLPLDAPMRWRALASQGGRRKSSRGTDAADDIAAAQMAEYPPDRASLPGRRDVAALQAGHHQIQSVSFARSLADAFMSDPPPPPTEGTLSSRVEEQQAYDAPTVVPTTPADLASRGASRGVTPAEIASLEAPLLSGPAGRPHSTSSAARARTAALEAREAADAAVAAAAGDRDAREPSTAPADVPGICPLPWFTTGTRVAGRYLVLSVYREVALPCGPDVEAEQRAADIALLKSRGVVIADKALLEEVSLPAGYRRAKGPIMGIRMCAYDTRARRELRVCVPPEELLRVLKTAAATAIANLTAEAEDEEMERERQAAELEAEASRTGSHPELDEDRYKPHAGPDEASVRRKAELARLEAFAEEIESICSAEVQLTYRHTPTPLPFTDGWDDPLKPNTPSVEHGMFERARPLEIEVPADEPEAKAPPQPPAPLMDAIMSLLRLVTVSVPNPMPERGSLARRAVVLSQGDKDRYSRRLLRLAQEKAKKEADAAAYQRAKEAGLLPVVSDDLAAFVKREREKEEAKKGVPEHAFLGATRMVGAFDNEGTLVGDEDVALAFDDAIDDAPGRHGAWLNTYSNAIAEAVALEGGREKEQLRHPRGDDHPYEAAVRSLVPHVEVTKGSLLSAPDRDPAEEAKGQEEAWAAAKRATRRHPHQQNHIPWVPKAARMVGHLDRLHQVPGLAIVGSYVPTAALFVRDPAVSSVLAVTVTTASCLEVPGLAEALLAINTESTFPQPLVERLFRAAVPHSVAPAAVGEVSSVLDDRIPHTIVGTNGWAVPEKDATDMVAGHRRADPIKERATGFRYFDVFRVLKPLVHVSSRPFGITMGAAIGNEPSVWQQRYTWHSEESVRHGKEYTARDFTYIVRAKFDQGPNDPVTITSRMAHEKVRKLDLSGLSMWIREQERREEEAAALKAKEELSRKVAEGRKRKMEQEKERNRLARQWREKNLRRAARLRGKTAALGLSLAAWDAKRKKPGARVVARFVGWERWVVMVPRSSLEDIEKPSAEELDGHADDAEDALAAGGEGLKGTGGEDLVYGEVWYHHPESGESQWDPPSVWPEDEWDAEEDEEKADVEYDSDGNTIRSLSDGEGDGAVARSTGRPRSSKSKGAKASAPDESLLMLRDSFVLGCFRRALRRWAVISACNNEIMDPEFMGLEGPPGEGQLDGVRDSDDEDDALAPGGDGRPSRPGTAWGKAPRVRDLPDSDLVDTESEADSDDDRDAKLERVGRGSGIDARGDGVFDLRVVFDFLDVDGDGIVSARDWGKATAPKSGATVTGTVPDDAGDDGSQQRLLNLIWPWMLTSMQRCAPPSLREELHEIAPQVAAQTGVVTVAPVTAPPTAGLLTAEGGMRPTTAQVKRAQEGKPLEPVSRGGTAIRSAALVELEEEGAKRQMSALKQRAAAAQSAGGAVGFVVDNLDPDYQIEELITPYVRLAVFKEINELQPTKPKGFTYQDLVEWVGRGHHNASWFGFDPDLPLAAVETWEAEHKRRITIRQVASWQRLLDPSTGETFYKSTITGQSVWEKSREQLQSEAMLRKLTVHRIDEEVAAERRWLRGQLRKAEAARRQMMKAKAAEAAAKLNKQRAATPGVAGAESGSSRPGSAAGSGGWFFGDTDQPHGGGLGYGRPMTAGRPTDEIVEELVHHPGLIEKLAERLGLPPPVRDVFAEADDAAERRGPAGSSAASAASDSRPATTGSANQKLSATTRTGAAGGGGGGGGSAVPPLDLSTKRPATAQSVRFAGNIGGLGGVGDELGAAAPLVAQSGGDGIGGDPERAEQRRKAQVEGTRAFPGVGWRQLRAPKNAVKLKLRATDTHVLGPVVTQVNRPNFASVVGLVNPSEALPRVIKYPMLPPQAHHISDIAAESEERRAEQVTAAGGDGILASKVPKTTLPSAALEAGGVSAAVGAALGDKERAMTEDERKAHMEHTAFLYVKNNKLAELENLMDEGLDIKCRDNNGNTLLLVAAQNGLRRMVKALLRRGATMNDQNLRGNTALHYAYAYKFEELAEYMKEKGADDSIVNGEGLTCYEGLDREGVDAI